MTKQGSGIHGNSLEQQLTHTELFAVTSFTIFGFAESANNNPQVGSWDLCVSTHNQLIQGIMDEVILGL